MGKMHLIGTLVEFEGHRLYVVHEVRRWFKNYLVCIDLTETVERSNGRISAGVLVRVSDDFYRGVDDSQLFGAVVWKSVKQLKRNMKKTIKIIKYVRDTSDGITENERRIILEYLDRAVIC